MSIWVDIIYFVYTSLLRLPGVFHRIVTGFSTLPTIWLEIFVVSIIIYNTNIMYTVYYPMVGLLLKWRRTGATIIFRAPFPRTTSSSPSRRYHTFYNYYTNHIHFIFIGQLNNFFVECPLTTFCCVIKILQSFLVTPLYSDNDLFVIIFTIFNTYYILQAKWCLIFVRTIIIDFR